MLELNATLEEHARLRIHVRNHGDDCKADANVSVRAPATYTLASAAPYVRLSERRTELDILLPAPLRGEEFDVTVNTYAFEAGEAEIAVALECDGESLETRVSCNVRGAASFLPNVNRVEIFDGESAAGDLLRGRVVLTNTGTASANVLALNAEGDLEDVTFEATFPFSIDPGKRVIVGVRARIPQTALDGARPALCVACRTASGNVELGEAHVVVRNKPRLEGTIEPRGYADVAVAPGERVEWELRLVNAGGAYADFTIALHVAGGVYLPGSTRIDGVPALDVAGTSPLWSRDGLRIAHFERGTMLRLEFATLAEMGAGVMNVLGRAHCEGRESLFESPAITLIDRGVAPDLPFRVEGVALRCIVPSTFEDSPPASTALRRSAAATFEAPMASYLAGLDGLMRHLWALAILCADTSDDSGTQANLAVTRIALRSVFDRLAIKLRMPHYPVRADDVLDSAAQDALDACEVEAGTLGTRLARATRLIASERGEYPELCTYRDALCTVLQGLHDDAALIDALVAVQPTLDACLDAVIEREIGVHA